MSVYRLANKGVFLCIVMFLTPFATTRLIAFTVLKAGGKFWRITSLFGQVMKKPSLEYVKPFLKNSRDCRGSNVKPVCYQGRWPVWVVWVSEKSYLQVYIRNVAALLTVWRSSSRCQLVLVPVQRPIPTTESIKFLIGITPCGIISFLFKHRGGWVSGQ